MVDIRASFISPDASLIYSAQFTSPDVLEPILDSMPFFLALHTKTERDRARITWRWIGMFNSCSKPWTKRAVLGTRVPFPMYFSKTGESRQAFTRQVSKHY